MNKLKPIYWKDLKKGMVLILDYDYSQPYIVMQAHENHLPSNLSNNITIKSNSHKSTPFKITKSVFENHIFMLYMGNSMEESYISARASIDTLEGAALDDFASDYFGVVRTPNYPDADFKKDLTNYVKSGFMRNVYQEPTTKTCNHVWYRDYQSMFSKEHDKYSCKHCGVKKESV